MVYEIRCSVTGKSYVGSTNNSVGRMNSHFGLLKRGKHHSIKLQRAWDKYGEATFYFDLCDYGISRERIRDAEQRWIDRLDSFKNGYNMTNYTGHGTKMPLEQRTKISEAAKRVGQNLDLRKFRSEQAKAMHRAGMIRYHSVQVSKTKSCKYCGVEFELERNPRTGAWKENKLCEACAVNCSYSTRR